MKTIFLILASLFSLAILLLASFQVLRLAIIELVEIFREAWHSPTMR